MTAEQLRDDAIAAAKPWLRELAPLLPPGADLDNFAIKLAAEVAKPAIDQVEQFGAQIAAEANGPGGHMTREEWADWSNDLASYLPEDAESRWSNPEGAQESIITDVLRALVEQRDVALGLHKARSLDLITAEACVEEECDHEDECPTEPGSVCDHCFGMFERHLGEYATERMSSEVLWPCSTARALGVTTSEGAGESTPVGSDPASLNTPPTQIAFVCPEHGTICPGWPRCNLKLLAHARVEAEPWSPSVMPSSIERPGAVQR